MDDGVGIAFGCADVFAAAVESAASVGGVGFEDAGFVVGGVSPATASAEFGFSCLDLGYSVVVPGFGAGGSEPGGAEFCKVWGGGHDGISSIYDA